MDFRRFIRQEGAPQSAVEAVTEIWKRRTGEHSETSRQVGDAIEVKWGEALQLCRKAALICWETGDLFVDAWLASWKGLPATHSSAFPGVVDDATARYMTLASLHAKAVATFDEVLLLLTNGYPDGAGARVRTLHELHVKAVLVAEDKSGVVAVRHHDSAMLDQEKMLRALHEGHVALNWDPPSTEELGEVAAAKNALVAHWGEHFLRENEWARPSVPRGGRRLTFIDLEAAAGLDNRRAIYHILNHQVHITPRSVVTHFRESDVGLPYGPVNENSTQFIAGVGLRILIEVTELLCELLIEEFGESGIDDLANMLELCREIVFCALEVAAEDDSARPDA